MTELIFYLLILVLAVVLLRTPLFCAGSEQKKYERSGMYLVAQPRGKIIILPALGIFVAVIVGVFLGIAILDGAWEEAGDMMILCIGATVFLVFVCFFGAYCQQKRHILYDEERILVGKVFDSYEEICWSEFAEMKIKNQDFFQLYDRDGKRRVSVDANMEGYHDFYNVSLRHLKPEYKAALGEGSFYQEHYTVKNGCGQLHYRIGEYYVFLVMSLLITGIFFYIVYSSGESTQDIINWMIEKEMFGVLIVPVFLIGSVVSLGYVSLQKISYDSDKILINRFPRKKVLLRWQEITRIEYSSSETGYRNIVLHTFDRSYTIKEIQFRRGFSEFLNELCYRYKDTK